MAKSAISSDVKAANSKLAQFLRRREEEEMILQIGKKKPKQLKEEKLPGGRGRWMLEPDYRAPSPMVDRPRTIQGATSFHFSYISISKEAIPTVNGAPVEGAFGKAKNAAVEHSKYIERDGAAEQTAGSRHAEYIERDEAVERIDTSALIAEQIERQIASVVNETPTAEEAAILGLVDSIPDGIPSVFSNISQDPFERQEFWRAVERIEATPRAHQIILDPEESPGWWNEIATTNKLEPEFKNHALMVLESYRQHMSQPLADGQRRKPFEAQSFPVSAEKAGKLIQQSQMMIGYRDSSPPFQFKSGRGGRVQFRLVAELPYELTAEDRALIVQNFCDHLGGLEDRIHPDGSKEKIGMMYTAVIHAPDSHNDRRNYHLHVVAYDRPARYLDEHAAWDFEVAEVYQDPGSRKDRVRYPYRQNKIGQIARVAPGQDKANAGIDFVPGLRRKFASINNAVLQARGVQRKLDHRKYTDMGIDRTPTEHLGTKAAALEAIGVPTTVGQLNALAIWTDAERAIRRESVFAERAYRKVQERLEKIAKEMTAVEPAHPSLAEFRKLVAERARMIAATADDREAIMTFDHMEAKAKSRAIRTRQTCIQFLADIENGTADRNTRMMHSVIEDRWKGAQAHLDEINEALAPHRDTLAKAANNIKVREGRCAEIDALLQPIIATLEDRLGVELDAGPKAEVSVDHPAASSASAVPVADPTAASNNDPAPAAESREADGQSASKAAEVADQMSDDLDAAVVRLEPASIEGLPIVEPTLAPRVDPISDQLANDRSTPDGLDPLRPEEPTVESDRAPEIIVPDMDAPSRNDQSVDANAAVGQSLSDGQMTPPQASAGDLPASPEPIDRRRKVTDPTLFELPVQEAPAKPGTSKGEYSDWDGLVGRILSERIPVKAEKTKGGEVKFTVPSLSPEENALLHAKRFSRRATGRLSAIHDRQQQEIQRLSRWIESQGKDEGALKIEGRTASLGKDVRNAVRTLFRHWRSHETILGAIRSENDRRIELAKAIANQPAPVVTKAEQVIEYRKAEAARKYPPADQAQTPEVRTYLRLLHEAAPEHELEAAADKIHDSAAAREDVNRHTAELAIAYRGHSDGHDQRLAQRQRDDRHGR